MDYTALDRVLAALGCPVLENEPLCRHTTFQIGGPADRFVTVESVPQLQGALRAAGEAGVPWLVLGKGSNLLVRDKGFRGAVVALSGDFKKLERLEGGRVRAGAGASLAALCAFARDQGLSGLEFAWGIPGSVGGAAYMDAGAYGGEMRDVVARVCHLTPQGEVAQAAGEELAFGYRKSRYTGGREVILWVEFCLAPGDPHQIAAKMDDLMGRRKAKQPYDMPSAGSVFKRPEGYFAAALIEECGLKGRAVGAAQISQKHAGFIVNNGGASCADVLALIRLAQEEVYAQKGVRLETEVRVIGEE